MKESNLHGCVARHFSNVRYGFVSFVRNISQNARYSGSAFLDRSNKCMGIACSKQVFGLNTMDGTSSESPGSNGYLTIVTKVNGSLFFLSTGISGNQPEERMKYTSEGRPMITFTSSTVNIGSSLVELFATNIDRLKFDSPACTGTIKCPSAGVRNGRMPLVEIRWVNIKKSLVSHMSRCQSNKRRPADKCGFFGAGGGFVSEDRITMSMTTAHTTHKASPQGHIIHGFSYLRRMLLQITATVMARTRNMQKSPVLFQP